MTNLTLTKTNQQKWFHNLVIFLAPLGVLYLTTIAGVMSQDGYMFSLRDFIPSQIAIGGMVLWVLNSALDYLRKLKA